MNFGAGVGDIIAVTSLALQIKKRYQNAPDQLRAVLQEVDNLELIVDNLTQDDQQSNTDHKNPSLDATIQNSRKLLEELYRILDKYKDIRVAQPSVGRRIKAVWKRLQFEPEDVKDVRGRITANVGILNGIYNRMQNGKMDKLISDRDTEERAQILNWLTTINHADRHNEIIRNRQEGTGQWLLNSPEYKQWLENPGQTLFCPGIPGAGKSTITAIIVEHLLERVDQGCGTGLVYIYNDYQRVHEQTWDQILATFVKQLCQYRDLLPERVKTLYTRCRRKSTRPSEADLSSIIESLLCEYSATFIVIDALDELDNTSSFSSPRSRLIEKLFEFQERFKAKNFATSRFVETIQSRFSSSSILEIRATDEDVERYINQCLPGLHSCVARDAVLQEEVKNIVMKAADGMFLLVKLYFDVLDDLMSPKAIKEALSDLQSRRSKNVSDPEAYEAAYETAYDIAMERIDANSPRRARIAKRLLAWVVCAQRPLTARELEHALAVEIGTPEFNKENIIPTKDMASLCVGLITIESPSSLVRLAHYTTQEYFNRNRKRWLYEPDADMAKVCITCLSFDDLGKGPCMNAMAFIYRNYLFSFYRYAAMHWHYHAAAAGFSPWDLQHHFMRSDGHVESWCQTQLEYPFDSNFLPYKRKITSINARPLQLYLYLESLFLHGMVSHVSRGSKQLLLKTAMKQDDISGALAMAIRRGNIEIANLILSTDEIELCHKESCIHCPLAASVGREDLELAKLVLEVSTGAVLCQKSLIEAVKRGNYDLMDLLLNSGFVNVNADDKSGVKTELKRLTRSISSVNISDKHVVKTGLMNLLLNRGLINVNVQDLLGKTALMIVLQNSESAAARIMMNQAGIDFTIKDENGDTALTYAVERQLSGIVNEFFKLPVVKTTEMNIFGQSPLTAAIRTKCKHIYEPFLDCQDTDLGMALVEAASVGDCALIQRLLNQNVDIETRSVFGYTPLCEAALGGQRSAVEMLIAAGADVCAKTNLGRTPLIEIVRLPKSEPLKDVMRTFNMAIAEACHQYSSLKYLRYAQLCCSIRSVTEHCVLEGVEDYLLKRDIDGIVHILLASDEVDINAKCCMGRTALSYASEKGHENVVRMLLEAKEIDICSRDKKGRTALSIAAEYSRDEIVRLLLESGAAQAGEQDEVGRSPLWYAAKAGSTTSSTATVKLLLDIFDIGQADGEGITPMMFAAKIGNFEFLNIYFEHGVAQIHSGMNKAEKWQLGVSAAQRDIIPEVCKLFDRHRMDFNPKDDAGNTLLHFAAQWNHGWGIKVLICELSMDFYARNNAGRTPLFEAAMCGHAKATYHLLQNGVTNVNTKDNRGMTPLQTVFERHWSQSDLIIIHLLLRAGAVDSPIVATPFDPKWSFDEFVVWALHHPGRRQPLDTTDYIDMARIEYISQMPEYSLVFCHDSLLLPLEDVQ